MTLQIIEFITMSICVIHTEQPSDAVIIIIAVAVFIAATVISGFLTYKIKRRSLKLQADKEENPKAADSKK